MGHTQNIADFVCSSVDLVRGSEAAIWVEGVRVRVSLEGETERGK